MRQLFTAGLLFSALAAATLHAGTADDLAARKRNDARTAINVLRVASSVQDAETVTIGSQVYEVDTHATATITTGRTRLNLSGGTNAYALGTLTLAGNAGDTETVTVGGKVYTFQTTLTNVANNVLIGASASASIDNLIAAINAAAGGGTTYATLTTINANVTAAAGAGDTMTATAKAGGTAGNSIGSTETLTSGSWGAATLASGADPTAAEFTTALQAAITATNVLAFDIGSTRIAAGEILLRAFKPGVNVTACTETLAGTNNAFAAAALYGGAAEPALSRTTLVVERAANATEAALQTFHFILPFTPLAAMAQVRSAAGALKAFDGSVIITGNRVDVNGTGSTDIADTDLVVITASN